MKALVYAAPLSVEVQDVPEPEAGAGEVLVDVVSSGICGSELDGVRSQSPFRVPPLVMGHEFAGVRTDTGERVVVNPIVSCGRCDLCQLGQGNICRERAVVGIHRPGAHGARVAVPETVLHPIPDSMSWEQAALIEPFANAVHAWRLVADRAPSRVGILGAGTIGLVMLQVARWRGALETVVTDLAGDRLAIARQLGADATGAALDGEFDVIFDAVGAASARRASVERLRPGGAAVWLGLHSPEPSFDALGLVRSEQAVLGSFAYTDLDFRQAIALAGTADPFWASNFDIEEGAAIFTELMEGRTDVVKALLRFAPA